MNARRSPVRIALRTLAALAALLALALLIATLALPGWITGRGAALATEALGRSVTIEHARLQPWRLAVVLGGVRIAGAAPGQEPLFTLTEVDAALSLRSLLRGHWVVESVELTDPTLRLARVGEGRYDVDDLIARFAKPAPPGEPPSAGVALYNLVLNNGRLLFDDQPVKARHELSALQLSLPFASTLATDVTVKVLPRLSGRLDGVPFDTQAEALPFADERAGRLALKLDGLDLAPLAAYVPASAPLRLQRGRLDLDLALDFAEHPKQPPSARLSARLSGRLTLHDTQLATPDGLRLLGWELLAIPLTDVQPLRRQVTLGALRWEAPVAAVRDRPVLAAAPPDPAASAPVAASPWQINVASFELTDGQLNWRDLGVDAVQLKLGAAAWPLAAAPVELDASLRLAPATLTARARVTPERLEANAELSDLAVERLAAWLPLPAGARITASASGKARLVLEQPLADTPQDRVQLALADVVLKDAKLTLPGTNGAVASVAAARLDSAQILPASHSLTLGQLSLDAPRVQLARARDGQLNIAALIPPAPPSAPASATTSPPWQLKLAGLRVERGALRWRDAAVPDGAAVVADALRLQLGPLAWPAKEPISGQLGVQLAALGAKDEVLKGTTGSLQWQGRVGLLPLSASGSVQAKSLPLHLFDGYLDPAWGLHLQRADLGLKAEFKAESRATQAGQAWQVSLQGDARLAPLALSQARTVEGERVIGEDLLSWQALQLDGLRLVAAPGSPPQVAVRDAVLDDVYARLIVNEQGRLNLRDLGPAEAASAAAAAPAPAASGPAVLLAIERTRVNRGLVDFSDRFVRPHYSARLSDLQGSLGAFASRTPAMAPLTLRGKVAGTGLLEIDGQLNPGGPIAMDVQANATDIELAPLSPYAGKYAGYAIERGKLSTRLHYQVQPGGQLQASNQIILNQLTFGDAVQSADATSLPVRFAVSLLKDRDGVIDVNLPVSGSLDDPDFSVGGIVWKLLLNLVGKAVTSPFALFSGSDSPEEAQIAFATGRAELAPDDKLDRIARLLADKPGVQLTLTGWADGVQEPAALRDQRLATALGAENAATPDAALKRLYQASKLPTKPKNVLGLAKDVPPEQMRALLLASYAVDDEALRQLAVARAVAVRDALLARGAPNARIFVAAPKLCDATCDPAGRPHVELTLGAN